MATRFRKKTTSGFPTDVTTKLVKRRPFGAVDDEKYLQGLIRVEIVATPDEREAAHRFWQLVQPIAEEFGATVRHLAEFNWGNKRDAAPTMAASSTCLSARNQAPLANSQQQNVEK